MLLNMKIVCNFLLLFEPFVNCEPITTWVNIGQPGSEGQKATLKVSQIDRCEITFYKVAGFDIQFETMEDRIWKTKYLKENKL